jgi:hypothetical protein
MYQVTVIYKIWFWLQPIDWEQLLWPSLPVKQAAWWMMVVLVTHECDFEIGSGFSVGH